MELTRCEQETIINYNEEEKTASIYTHNRALRRKLDRLTQERPEDCRPGPTAREGQVAEYIVPKAWVKVNPPRRLTEVQREQLQKASASTRFTK